MNTRTLRLSLCIAATLFAWTSAGAAEFRPAGTASPGSVPSGINYQGRLEENGVAVSDFKRMAFIVYDAPTGGTALWSSGVLMVNVQQGLFNTILDISTSSLSGGNARYLQVQVEGTDLSPREVLNTVPYALVAKALEGTLDISGGGLSVSTAPAASSSLYVSSQTGHVGIGSSSPAYRLQVSSGAGETGDILVVSTGASNIFRVSGEGEVRANKYYGNGSALTGVLSADPTRVLKVGDTMTGALNMSNAAVNLTGVNGNVVGQSSITTTGGVFGNGAGLTNLNASNLASGTVPLTRLSGITNAEIAAGAAIADTKLDANVARLSGVQTFSGAKTFTAGPTLTNVALTLTGASGNIVGQASVTASGFFGNGAGLSNVSGTDVSRVADTGDTMTGALNMSNVAVNLTGVNGNVVGQSSITTTGGVFGNGAGLTNLNAGNLASGTVPLTRLSGITNTEIAAGANIADTKLNTIATSGKVSDSALSANVDLLNGIQTISAVKTFTAGPSLTNVALTLTGASGNVVSASSVTASGLFAETLAAGGGSNIVYRCLTDGGGVPSGTLTINAAQCATSTDTGLRVK